jgi:hypothetical protein
MTRLITILLLFYSSLLFAQQRTVTLKLKTQPTNTGIIGTVHLTVVLDISSGSLKAKCTPGKITDIEGVMVIGRKYTVQELGGISCINEIDWGASSNIRVSLLVDGAKIKKAGELYGSKTTTEYLQLVTNSDLFNNSIFTHKPEENERFRKLLIEKFTAGAIQLSEPQVRNAAMPHTCFEEIRKKLGF